MKYNAIGLNEKLEKGRVAGEIELVPGTLTFKYKEQEVKLNINRTTISQGGTGNRFVYFKDRYMEEWTIYTDDKAILKRPELSANSNLKAGVSKIKTNRAWFKLSVISLAVIGVVLLLGFFLFRGPIIAKVAQSFPPAWERKLSSTMMQSIVTGNTVIDNPEITAQLQQITKPLVDGLADQMFQFSFTIIDDPSLNAFALPGGDIVIHSGLILAADNAEEVAGVLAHEISHVTQRHHLRGMLDKIGFFVVVRAILGDASGVGTELAIAGSNLESLKYSRNYETESDEIGWELLIKSDINPEGMIGFFKKLAAEDAAIIDNETFTTITNYLSTHPDTKQRIETLLAKDKPEKTYSGIGMDFDDFKEKVRSFVSN